MILVFAVVLGLAVGYLKAKISGKPYQPVALSHVGLLLIAVLPQYLAFYLPATRTKVPDQWIPIILISTQLILMVFVWMNRKVPYIWLLGVGLLLNFVVISLNGGWMPISPETLNSQAVPAGSWQIGSRHGYSKDMVLEKELTNLWLLSDILTLPSWIPYRVAFSIGDVIIALGVMGLLTQTDTEETDGKEAFLQEN